MTQKKLDTHTPQLMAIVNATPDSFSDGGAFVDDSKLDISKMAAYLQKIVDEGADILDVGGESTRPGAKPVSLQQEMDRVLPVVEWAKANTELPISVDTSSPELMLEAARLGANLINDVRALQRDQAIEAAAQSQLHVCLMHMQGSPQTMQNSPEYQNPVSQIMGFIQERVLACLDAGIARDKIWIDPGFGFGKTLEHNLKLLQQLPEFASLGFPVLVGMSRKSMIGHLLGRDLPERLPGSLALAMMALERGAKILRVHDVKATRDIIDVYCAVNRA